MAYVGEDGVAEIERRSELFDVIARDFACSVGKVGGGPLHIGDVRHYVLLFEWPMKRTTLYCFDFVMHIDGE